MLNRLHRKLLRFLAQRKRKQTGRPLPLSFFRAEKVKRVLVVSCTALGDTLLSTPAIKATRNLFPEAHISWLIKPSVAPLVNNNPHVDVFLPFPKGINLWRLWPIFRKFDLVLSFHDSDETPTALACLAEVPFVLRSAMKDEKARPFLSEKVPFRPEVHLIEQRLDVLRFLCREPKKVFDTRLVLPIEKESLLFAEKLLGKEGLKIGFQCLASRSYRDWPLNRFRALAQALLKRFEKAQIFLIGSSKDQARLAFLEEERVINLAGKIPLHHLGAVIKRLDLLVTVDTGPMHVAFATRTPTVCLFVPSEVRHTGPYQDLELHRIIRKDRPCNPCQKKYCSHPWCMELISVEEVFSACEEALA